MKNIKQLENEIHELKIKRSDEWKKGKTGRSDNDIRDYNKQINKLKSKVKKHY